MVDCRSMLVVLCLAASSGAFAASSASYSVTVGGATVAVIRRRSAAAAAAAPSGRFGQQLQLAQRSRGISGDCQGQRADQLDGGGAATTLTINSESNFDLNAPASHSQT
jgi:hypothetical protein